MFRTKTPAFDTPLHLTRPLLPDLGILHEMLQEVWDARWLTNSGAQHYLLEERLRTHLKVPHLSLFNNGTIGLIVGCQSLRLSGEVITTPFTFPATPHVLAWNGIQPVFADVEPMTMNLDPEKLESMITARTTAILAVHVFGNPCDVVAIQKIAERHGLRVLFDAAHAFGVEIEGRGIGSFGDISMFSFHATKLFHTAEGGALTFNDPNLRERIALLKNFGIKNELEVTMPGINGKMNEIQAVLGLAVLSVLEEERRRRRDLSKQYRDAFAEMEGITIATPPIANVRPSYQYMAVRIDETLFGRSRDHVCDFLRRHNVLARRYFYPLCSDYPCYRQLPSASPGNLPVAHRVSREILCLPFHGGLSSEVVARVCSLIRLSREEDGGS